MSDIGFVAKRNDTFFTGYDWDKQLRKAKIYHSEKYLKEAMTYRNVLDYIIVEVEIREI